MIIEQKEYINAVRPFRNGCSFKLLTQDGTTLIEPGCYLLVNLLQGVELELYRKWLENSMKPFKVDLLPETIQEIESMHSCVWCS